jgi:UDP-N-acetylglucosamine--N-acetylmuramyl-(pentapeptide) pyrophosphoryl-undecaprenol N-acetylglucosamine transferase
VRHAFFDILPRRTDSTPALLVFGGSQGAHAINQAMIQAAPRLRECIPGIRVVHQTGERDYDETRAAYARLGEVFEAYRFIDDMPAAFANADVILCRSGASTVAEIAAAGKPAIFVPFPRAADDHQKRNAEALERGGAAMMLEEVNLNPATLVDMISSLFADANRLSAMGKAARGMSHPNAAAEIAGMAFGLVKA